MRMRITVSSLVAMATLSVTMGGSLSTVDAASRDTGNKTGGGHLATSSSSSSTHPERLFAVPTKMQSLYDKYSESGQCEVRLDTLGGSWKDAGNHSTGYCAEKGMSEKTPPYVSWMANMDIDCDGSDMTGACGVDQSYQSQTAYMMDNQSVDALEVPYVVINDQNEFKPESFNIQQGGIVAVVCNGKVTYGIFADTNAASQMGEVSLNLGQTCYGTSITGNNGGPDDKVLYVAFADNTVNTVKPTWSQIKKLGDEYMSKYFGSDGSSYGSSSTASGNNSSGDDSGTSSSSSENGSSSNNNSDNLYHTTASQEGEEGDSADNGQSSATATSSNSSGDNEGTQSNSSSESSNSNNTNVEPATNGNVVYRCKTQRKRNE